ncbi:MAG: cache domain-containing protein [Bacteroidales bacterium]|nr:cache domain-containing protein [Bacteroidales bacterium]
MNKSSLIRRYAPVVLIAAAVLCFAASLFSGGGSANLDGAAADLSRKVERRMRVLDRYIDQGLHGDKHAWMQLDGLPEDMVVYRYVEDTLQSWVGQFPIRNDDIRPRTLLQRMGDSRSQISSPLADVTEDLRFVNHGPKWYLEKAVEGDGCKVIAGLEIVNELRAGSLNGTNRHFGVDERYTVQPLSESVGAPVMVDGVPLFKLTAETRAEPSQRHSALLWLAVALLLAGTLLLLSSHPSLGALAAVQAVQLGLLTWLYFYGRGLGQVSQLFSPLLYADGPFLYSLGAVVLVNLAINLVVLDYYLVRWTLLKATRRRNSRGLQLMLALVCILLIVCTCTYLHLSFKSILVNSNINLELYKISLLTRYTGLVYLSFLALTLALPLLLQMLSPLLRSLTGIRYDMFDNPERLLYAAAVGIYFVTISSTLGFRKEQQRVDVWANRLAMDRDIALEIQLRSAEAAIAADPMIGVLSALEGSSDLIRSRISTTYMGRIAQDYDINVILTGPEFGNFLDRIRGGIRLGDNSHFFYSTIGSGRTSYTGLFTYYVQKVGSTSVLVTVESKHNREDRGYLSLLGLNDPGRVSLPPVYSWAKYSGTRLVQYKGSYPFPTVFSGGLQQHVNGHADMDGFCHFINEVSEDEVIVISRPSTEWLYYVVEGFLFSIIAFAAISALSRRRRRTGGRAYYQTRIGLVIYVSLILTLVAMAVFSVWFVYKRNNADMQSIMTARINTLQSMMQEHLRQVDGPEDIGTSEVAQAVEMVGNNLKCDITLFSTSGQVVMSTTPEVYERMILGHRLDDKAMDNILYGHKRFYMNRERVGRRSYYALYAPVLNSDGRMVAIISSPFTNITGDLETEAILHIATVITIFLLLLMLARFVTFEVVSRLFRPITVLRRKMTVTDVDHLEPLIYNQDDELTPLVQAYNRMVQDLGESSRRLTQAERDKAWTDMARRVAHDLKNPLTPIKLQLQMLIRMKASGNPLWQERFDEVAQTVLYHVDLLADSADQFSTFAKMYDQKPERLDLNALVQQEVDLFDSRDDISIEYFGLQDAWVEAPRPQLTRVVVNLITNAIQAVDENPGDKRLVVSLRNASEDGFYEIVVEDNGPGVSEQNQDKIFTPDFTTKTSGSGLGLAICRRIAEHCGGSISYSRSFALGGAAFTVKYPKA